MRQSRKRWRRAILPVAVSVTGLLGGSIAGAVVTADPQEKVPVVRPGVSVDGIPLAGKSRREVREFLDEYSTRLLSFPLRVQVGKLSEVATAEQMGGTVALETLLDAVLETSVGDQGLFDRIRRQFIGPEPRPLVMELDLKPAGVARRLRRLSARTGTEPVDARKSTVNGVLTAFPAKPGKSLNAVDLAARVRAVLSHPDLRKSIAGSLDQPGDRRSWLAARKPLVLNAALQESLAEIGLDDLEPITHCLATFRTSLSGSSRNRIHNIELACKAIDGLVLMPGETFSYNETVGPRVPSAGYREAPVIIKGKLEPGTGGGICQVSSTLYNAVLLADLQVVSRAHHAIPVKYVPVGRDATVVDGVIDFRFRNRLEFPVALDAKVSGRNVVVKVHGHPDDEVDVTLVSGPLRIVPAAVKTIEDPSLPSGTRVTQEKAQSGRRVTVSRVIRRDGKVLREEVVSNDYYRPFPGVVRVGTASPAKPAGEAEAGRAPQGPPAPGAEPGPEAPPGTPPQPAKPSG